MKHIVEVLSLAREPQNLNKFQKLDKHRYFEKEFGEIFEYNLNEKRKDNIAGLKKTFRKLRHLINNNFVGASNELFVTLTYAENMTDTKKLYKDFDLFIKKIKLRYPNIDYISVVEPQSRGAWHCHVLIRFNDRKTVFIKNDEVIAPLWGHGFTKTKNLKNIDNIGAYLNAYLTDVEICDENIQTFIDIQRHNDNAFDTVETSDGQLVTIKHHNPIDTLVVEKEIEDNGEKIKKQFVKGARLHMYPSGMNIYRASRGIEKPDTEQMEYRELKKIVGSRTPNYFRTIELYQDEKPINSITYEQYNLKRKENQ